MNPLHKSSTDTTLLGSDIARLVDGQADPFESNDDLLACLPEEERSQAKAALQFLEHVKTVIRSGQSSLSNPAGVDGRTTMPERLGNYTLVRSIGRGGFAEVFLAYDEVLDRHVAIKIPLVFGGDDDEYRKRFEREARAAAVLSHPQIVPVFEYGTIGPTAFIAYAWIDGPDLATWLLRPPPDRMESNPSIRQAAEIVAALAEAMEHAHQRGVIHRDLKPSNVLVENPHENQPFSLWQRLKITDFGLAVHFSDSNFLTADGSAIGTPAYMSPEQAVGQRNVTPATDIWSLGVILYELIVGQTPFAREGKQLTIDAIRFDEPASIRQVRRDAPLDLDAICLKCLSKNPLERYPSAADLAIDLRAWLEGKPVTARPVNSIVKLQRWSRRNPVLFLALIFTLLTLAIASSVTTWKWREAKWHLLQTQAEKLRVDQNLNSMSSIVNLMLESLSRNDLPDELTDAQRSLLTRVLQVEEEILQRNKGHVGLNRSLIQSYIRIGELHLALGEYQQVVEHCQQAFLSIPELSPAATEVSDMHWDSWMQMNFLECLAVLNAGDGQAALDKLDQIESRFDAGPSGSHVAADYYQLKIRKSRGQARILLNQPVRALDEFLQVANWDQNNRDRRLDSELKTMIAASYISQSYTEHRMTRYADSRETIRRAIELLSELLDENPNQFSVAHHLANAHYQLASTLAVIHVWQIVEENLQKSVSILNPLLDKHGLHPGIVHSAMKSYAFLGRAHWKLGKKDLAFTASQRADQLFQPPLDSKLMIQQVYIQNLVERSSWLGELNQTNEASDLARLAHERARQWLSEHSDSIGALQSLYSAQFNRIMQCSTSLPGDHAEFMRDELRTVGERLIRLKPNRESLGWIWDCQERAWKLAAQISTADGDFEETLNATQAITEIPNGPAPTDYRPINAATCLAKLLSQKQWYGQLRDDQQTRASSYVLMLLQQSQRESKLKSSHLLGEYWRFLDADPGFVELKKKLQDGTDQKKLIEANAT